MFRACPRSLFDTLQQDLTTYPNLRFGSAEAAMEVSRAYEQPLQLSVHVEYVRLIILWASCLSQEYVEAQMFLVWRSEGRLPTKAELGSVTSVRRDRSAD